MTHFFKAIYLAQNIFRKANKILEGQTIMNLEIGDNGKYLF